MNLSIVKTHLEWDLVPFKMMKQTEEPQTGNEESNKGKNPPQDGECPPKENEELGAKLTEAFFTRNQRCMHAHTAQKTPACGQDKKFNWIKSKSGLVEDCCETPCCGCLRLEQEQD